MAATTLWGRIGRDLSWFIRDTESRKLILKKTDELFQGWDPTERRMINPSRASRKFFGLKKGKETWQEKRMLLAAQAWVRFRCVAERSPVGQEVVQLLREIPPEKIPPGLPHEGIMEILGEIASLLKKEAKNPKKNNRHHHHPDSVKIVKYW